MTDNRGVHARIFRDVAATETRLREAIEATGIGRVELHGDIVSLRGAHPSDLISFAHAAGVNLAWSPIPE